MRHESEIPANELLLFMYVPPEVSKTAEVTAIALGHANTTYQECSSIVLGQHNGGFEEAKTSTRLSSTGPCMLQCRTARQYVPTGTIS